MFKDLLWNISLSDLFNIKQIIMKQSLLILGILIAQIGFCCSCQPLSKIDDQQYDKYDLIVSGTILKITDKGYERTVLIKVDTYYKGTQSQKTIKIMSPSKEGVCAISPKVGEHWLIYAAASGKIFSTNLCTRTMTMNPKAWDYKKDNLREDLEFLEKKIKNTPS